MITAFGFSQVQPVARSLILPAMGSRIVSVAAVGLIACGGKGPPPAGPDTPEPGPVAADPPADPPAGDPTDKPAVVPVPSGAVVGTAHPIVVEAVARDGAWVVICQARTDTNGDGEIAVNVGYHGDTWGDSFKPYVVRGAGEGEPIDSLVGYTRDGRWLVALRGGKLSVLEVTTGLWRELPGADVRDDGVPLGPHRVASVARGGDVMTYFRDDETIVIRALSTGAEDTVKVPGARVWRVEVEPAGAWARVYVIKTDTDKDGKLTWPSVHTSLSDRDCRGPIMSYSTGGWSGDKPDEMWLDLTAGRLQAARGAGAPVGDDDDPELGEVDGRPVLAIDRTGRKLIGPDESGRGIPKGPLRWVEGK